METQITTQENKLPAIPFSGGDITDAGDIVIPSLLPVGGGSNFVADGKAQIGDIYDTDMNAAIAKKGESIEVIPIKAFTYWNKWQMLPGAKEATKITSVKHVKEAIVGKWTYETVENGLTTTYKKVMKVFVVLPNKPNAMPYCFNLKGLAVQTAKNISTYFQLSDKFGTPYTRTVFKLACVAKPWEGKTHFVFDMTKFREAAEGEMSKANEWRKELTTKAVQTSDEDAEPVPF